MLKDLVKLIFSLKVINYCRMYYQAFKSNVKIRQHDNYLDILYRFRNQDVKLLLRKYPSSDWLVFNQIFLFKEYENLFSYANQSLEKERKVISVIDGGANIGLTSIFAKFFFTNSEIYCIEPSFNNVEMMKTNFGLCNVKDFHIIHGALWDSKTHLVVKQVGSEWAITVSEGEGDNKIETFTITEIMEKNKIDVVDILKLDIEGSEKQLFNNNPEVFFKKN